MTQGVTISFKVTGAKETQAALERLARESPARARRAVNRTMGVVRKRVVRSVSNATGISQRVLAGSKRSGTGYIKQIKGRSRPRSWIVALVEGVRFSRLGRKRLGRLQRKPGGLGKPFFGSMPSGHSALFERVGPQRRAAIGRRSFNLPIREVVIPIQPYAQRAIRIHMKRGERTVYPAKLWEELQKSIQRKR